jgi:hypothetical protein
MVANLCGVWIAAVLTDGHVLNVFGPSSCQIRKTSVDFVKERDWPAASDAKMICSLPLYNASIYPRKCFPFITCEWIANLKYETFS